MLSYLKILSSVFILVSASAFACKEDKAKSESPNSASHKTESSRAIANAVENTKKATGTQITLHIPKISCGACAAKISKILKSEYQIEDTTVDLDSKMVSFGCKTSACPLDKITASLANAGYIVTN